MTHLLIQADARKIPLADGSVHCVVTSPPYWSLRDYSCDGQIGLESTPDEFVTAIVAVFREAKRILRDDGTCWLNLGDSYHSSSQHNHGKGGQMAHNHLAPENGWAGHQPRVPGLKQKDLVGIPWRVAFALQADGWWLRSAITWCKTSPMPESVTDRPTSATEMLFLLTKSERYFYDADAVRVPSSRATLSRDKYTRVTTGKDGPYSVQHDHETPSHPAGRNLWNYWVLPSESYAGAHFATFPRKLVEPCIRAGTSAHGACPKCGAPWERVTERETLQKLANVYGNERHGPKADSGWRRGLPSLSNNHKDMPQSGTVTTIGWRPTCSHDTEPVPCVVLDPFSGVSTTGVVALALKRHYIGLDLSTNYLTQAKRRIERPHQPLTKQREQAHPLFAHIEDA